MAYNVTESDVKTIMETELSADQLAPFLRQAEVCVDARLTGSGYGDDLLNAIVLNLAAHFATNKDPEIAEEEVKGQTRGKYRGTFGSGLDRSSFGQTVKELDFKGILTAPARPVVFSGFGAKNNNYP